MSIKTLLLAAATLAGVAGSAQAATFSFADASGRSNPFAITAGGNTASFTSTAGAGTFSIADAGLFSFGTALGDYGSFNGDPLTITFATPIVDRILISFGLEDAFGLNGADTLTATTDTGQVITAGTSLNASSFPEPEGTLSFVPTGRLTSLTLTSSNPFAIASIDVPEPMSVVLLGSCLAGLMAVRRRA